MSFHSTVITGGGWAGLAAAVELSRQNIPVTVFESAKQLGGRARTVNHDGLMLDNGQHLMIGAYREMLSLLKIINVNEKDVFLRIRQQLEIINFSNQTTAFKLKLPKLPAPFNLLMGMLSCPSLTIKQKFKTLYKFDRLLKKEINQDISVDEWLIHAGLPVEYTEFLLKPLCLAALTTHTHEASARAFQSVLQQTFNGPASNTNLLIPARDLGRVFPEAAKNYIESRGGQVLTEHRVTGLKYNEGKITSLTVNEQKIQIDHLILATPARGTQQLLSNIDACKDIHQRLDELDYEPVTTVYLQYSPAVKLPLPMMGVVNATSEWLFDRSNCNQPGLIAAVISANGAHMKLSNEQLSEQVAHELASQFPDWPEAESTLVIREKRATLRCIPNIDKLRPDIQTPVKNLRLCGDYVYIEENNQPGLPSTLEGAMRSGVKCAQQLIQELI